MISSDPIQKISIPFANVGAKNVIPNTSQIGLVPGAASFPDGFPPQTMIPLAAGGIPPSGQDVNGILNALSVAVKFYNAGVIMTYDSAFSAAIGGYPRGSLLWTGVTGQYWFSLIENNTTVPGASGAQWTALQMAGAGALVTSFNGRVGPVGLITSDVTGALGFTPVQQGGGINQSGNKVYLGYNSGDGTVRVTIDGTDFGPIVFNSGLAANLANYVPFSRLGFNSGQSGYKIIPSQIGASDFYIQWDRRTTFTGFGDVIGFPIAFPNACLVVNFSEGDAQGWSPSCNPTIYGWTPANRAGFALYGARISGSGSGCSYQGGITYNYIAIGY